MMTPDDLEQIKWRSIYACDLLATVLIFVLLIAIAGLI
jgi:hypothetical protein